MKVLSLFDGMACGMIAMQIAGVGVESYDAYEIDKYAIKTAQHNFPMIKEHGDVFNADFTQYEGVDFLIGGSPCTYWSIAQTKNRETVASGMGWELFSQYVRALHEAKPKYFIYENNKSMSKDIRASIDKAFGFEAVLINSALVSAQNRQRLYWVGKRNDDGTYSKMLVEQPEDRGILLRDILETGIAWHEKPYCITATEYKGSNPQQTLTKHRRTMVAEPINVTDDGKEQCLRSTCYKDGIRNIVGNDVDRKTGVAEPVKVGYVGNGGQGNRVYSVNGKAVAQTAQSGGKWMNTGLYAEPINVTADGKAQCLRATCYKDGIRNIIANEVDKKTGVAEPINVTVDGKSQTLKAQYCKNSVANFCCYSSTYGASGVADPVNITQDHGCAEVLNVNPCGHGMNGAVIHCDGKCRTLTTNKGEGPKIIEPVCLRIEFYDDDKPIKYVGKDGKEITIYEVKDGKITIKGKQYPIKLKDGFYIIRKLTVCECMRLQTVPEWYEFPVSDSQAYKMLGNGWTCEVIAHILKYLKEA